MSFEGYKGEAREVNTELLHNLLELTIRNISKNPIGIYSTRNNHGSPIESMINNIFSKKEKSATKENGLDIETDQEE